MKKWMVMFVLVLTAVVLGACGSSSKDEGSSDGGKSYKFKLGHEANETHIKSKVAEKFAEELEKNSDGRMKVDLYPGNQLGKEADMEQQVESGSLDFAILSNGTMSSISESLNGWFMPYLFTDLEAAKKATTTDAAKSMMTDLEKKSMKGYGVFFAGQRHVMANKAVNTPADLKGVKIRIPGSPVFEAYYKAIGSGPTSMPLPEVYTSLSTGVIDAVDTDLDAAVSQKFYEATKVLSLTKHIVFPEVVIGSKDVMDQLSEEDQKIVEDTWQSVIDWGIDESIQKNEDLLNELKDLGVEVVEPSDLAAFKSDSASVYAKFESNDVIKAFIEENK